MRRIIILALLVLALVAPAAAWKEDFQNPYEGITYVGWGSPYAPDSISSTRIEKTYLDTIVERTYVAHGDTGYANHGNIALIAVDPQLSTDYVALTLHAYSKADYLLYSDTQYSTFMVFDKSGASYTMAGINRDGTVSTVASGFASQLASASKPCRVEFVRSGQYWHYYINGVDKGAFLKTAAQPYIYWGFLSSWSANTAGHVTIEYDDITTSGLSPYVVSTIPEGWYVLNDTATPRVQGVYNRDDVLVYEDYLHYTYGAPSPALGGDLRYASKIETQHFRSGRVVNTTYLSQGTYAATLQMDVKEWLMEENAPFGLYQVKIYRSDDQLMDSTWLIYTNIQPSDYSIAWDRTQYLATDNAVVNITLDSPDYGAYTYGGSIVDLYGTEKQSWTVNTDISEEDIEFSGWDAGTYLAILTATDKSTGTEYQILYDTMEISDVVHVYGTVYNIENGTALSGATTSLYQNGEWYNATTLADGTYNQTDLITDYPISFYASQTGYTHNDFQFTPLTSRNYTVDLYLYPANLTYTGTAIAGQVYNDAYNQAVSGATVTVENGTWSTTTTSSTTGYYLVDNLTAPGTYTISASAAGYSASSEYSVTAESETITTQEIALTGVYSLTVNVRDSSTHTAILDTASIALSPGDQTATTTSGSATFTNLEEGIYTVSVSASGYYGTSQNVYVDENETTTIYLTKQTESTPFAYPPHNVKFIVRSAFGGPIEGVTVQATGYETTMGSWSWLFDLLGLDYEETQIHNQTMNGTTGTDGAINFMMIEAIKYRITFAKAGEIETTWEGFPKDEYYTIWASGLGPGEWFEHGSDPLTVINFTVAGTSADDTSAALTVYYNDTLAETTSATAYLNQTFINGTEVNIDSHTETSDSWNHTFTVAGDHRGESYIVRLRAIHETYGNITRDYGVHYKPAPTSLGLPEDLLLFAAMGVMLFTCLFFGQTSVGAGCIIFALEGWIFFWLGWLADLGSEYAVGTVLVIITFVAFLVNVMHRSKRERFT